MRVPKSPQTLRTLAYLAESLIQDLIDSGLSHVRRCSPDGDKIMRLHAQTAAIENGFVWLPDAAPWLADYVAELTAFPAGRHDDQVDSTSQALAWARAKRSEPAGPEFWAENLAHVGREGERRPSAAGRKLTTCPRPRMSQKGGKRPLAKRRERAG